MEILTKRPENMVITRIASLDPRARESSFKEYPVTRKIYKDILGTKHIDHFSINCIPTNKKMIVFSIHPEIAYSLYAKPEGIKLDAAISPDFYENFDSYLWEACYDEHHKNNIILKKEVKFGIRMGVVFMRRILGQNFLYSFATKRNPLNFMEEVMNNEDYFYAAGDYCLEGIIDSYEKYAGEKEANITLTSLRQDFYQGKRKPKNLIVLQHYRK